MRTLNLKSVYEWILARIKATKQKTRYCVHHCKWCGGGIEFPIEGAGQSIKCPHCDNEEILVPPQDRFPNSSVFGFAKKLLLRRSVQVIVAVVVVIFLIAVRGDSEKAKARDEIRRQVIEFKVALTNGLSFNEFKDQKRRLETSFEYHRKWVPDDTGVILLLARLEGAEEQWKDGIINPRETAKYILRPYLDRCVESLSATAVWLETGIWPELR